MSYTLNYYVVEGNQASKKILSIKTQGKIVPGAALYVYLRSCR